MIPLYDAYVDSEHWQKQLADVISCPKMLLSALELSHLDQQGAALGHKAFLLRVPKAFVSRMNKGDPQDPLLRQVMPLEEETWIAPGYLKDPLEEKKANTHPGIIHKYGSRVLLIAATACAVHCRYCFRRHFPYADNRISGALRQRSIEYLKAHKQINEVILSGGDPFVLKDRQIDQLLSDIEGISHIKRVRFHTRLPVVIPSRMTDALVKRLAGSRLKVTIVIHCNHAQELDESVAIGIAKLHRQGIWVLNQSVLLKGVNDDIEPLVELSERLHDIHIMPYYLHLLDKVQGAQHFEVPLEHALRLHQELKAQLPGFLVPKLVQEIPDESSKVWVDSNNQ